MNNWTTLDGKTAIVRAVFQHLRDNPQDIPRILDYGLAREIVARIGRTEVPADVRVFCLPFGDSLKGGDGTHEQEGLGGSLILEIPPLDLPINGPDILNYACTYSPWIPGTGGDALGLARFGHIARGA